MRFDISGVRMDIFAFIGRNRFKFFAAALLAVAGFLFGIINAFTHVITDEALLAVQKYGVIRLIMGERTFFGYLLARFLLHLLLAAILTFFGVREFLAYFSYAVILIYAYQYGYLIGAVFCYAGLSVLPLMLVCIIPMFLIFLCILMYYAVYIIHFSCSARIGYFRELRYYAHSVKMPFIYATVAVFAVALVESVLAALLTMGMVL